MSHDKDKLKKDFDAAARGADVMDDGDRAFVNTVRSAPAGLRDKMLIVAAKEGNSRKVALLFANGATVGKDAFIGAVIGGHEAVVRLMIAKDHKQTDILKDEALSQAARYGHASLCRIFLAQGAKPGFMDNRALCWAALHGNPVIVDMLLRAGADVNAQGGAFLCMAIQHAQYESAKALLTHGANPRNMHMGKDALRWAQDQKHEKTAQLVSSFLQDPPQKPRDFFDGMTLEDLQKSRADLDGFNPMQIAAHMGYTDIILSRALQNGRALGARDLIVATPERPRTALHLLGQQGRLPDIFAPHVFVNQPDEMARIMHYVPAAFAKQVDIKALREKIARDGFKLRLAAKKHKGLDITRKSQKK